MLPFPQVRAVALGSQSHTRLPNSPAQTRFRESRVLPLRSDHGYILRVISYLKWARKQQGLSLKEVTRRAGIRKGLINRAEREGFIPRTSEFKAWARALDLSWERVWTQALPVAHRPFD